MQNLKAAALVVLVLASASCWGQSKTTPVAPNATAELLAQEFTFTEGPASDRQGNVYFTDQPNNKIYVWTTEGKLKLFRDNAGRSNGLYFDKNGNLLACADENNQLWSISPNGSERVLLSNTNGKRMNGPNDLWIAPKGAIYFTDPYYERPYWKRGPQEQHENVYLLTTKGVVQCVDSTLNKPNGIVGTPDGKKLYVADIGAGKTYVYQIGKDGKLSSKQLFADKGSDGMTIDSKGNIYLTGDGVWIYSKEGELLDHIKINEDWTANVCFGGKDNSTLFITAMKSLYSIKMRVKGVK
jgi:gluconolactonase